MIKEPGTTSEKLPGDDRLYRRLFEASTYAVLVYTSSQIVAATPAAVRLYGYSDVSQIIGRHPADLSPPKQADGLDSRAGAASHIREAYASGISHFEWLHQRADGTTFPAEVSMTRLDFQEGPVLRATIRDLSEQKEMEARLRQRADSLEHRLHERNQELLESNQALEREVAALQNTERALSDQKAFFKQLFDASPEGIVLLDREDRILKVNQALLDIFGYQVEEVAGRTINELIVPDMLEQEGSALSETVLDRRPVQAETKRQRKDGVLVDVSILGAPVLIGDDQIAVYGIYRDISGQRRMEEESRLAAAALENTAEGVMILDRDRRVVKVNKAFARITGYGKQEVIGRPMPFRSLQRERGEDDRDIWRALDQDGHWEGEVWNRRKGGETYPELLSLSTLKDGQGQVSHYVCVFNDISEHKEYQRQLEFLAHHDTLTGLPNRTLFQQECQQAIGRAKRSGKVVGILFLDMDHFKTINDSLGHPVGDRFLKDVASRLKEVIRESDLVSRFGGDEFAILVDNIDDPEDVATVANKVREVLSEPVRVDEYELAASCSIGISLFPADGEDASSLLRNADTAMYRAKEKGRNCIQFFSADMNARAYEELLMSKALRDALDQEQFVLHYQPSVCLDTFKIVGVEALVRWEHPEQGLVPPSTFIPLAERNGLIGELGRWVFREACRQAVAWRDQGLPSLRMAVNVSARQFGQRHLITELSREIDSSGMLASDLHIEITESMMMENPDRARRTLEAVARMGVDIAVDDFGTGHSSLSYLKDFPIHYLKVDRSFVMGLPEDQDALAIVRAIVAMAKNLKLKVIAEGVETARQRDLLAEMGCDEAQGYFFSRPRRAADIAQLLKENRPLP